MIVLIAEDNPSVAELAAVYAEMAGCEAEIAMDGQSALEAVQSHHVDLMILDAHLPVMSGMEVLRSLKDTPDAPPVAVYSADDDMRQESLRLGAVAFLPKTKPEQLMRFIESHAWH